MARKGREMRRFLTIVSLIVGTLIIAVVAVSTLSSIGTLQRNRQKAKDQVINQSLAFGGLSMEQMPIPWVGQPPDRVAKAVAYFDPAKVAAVGAGDSAVLYGVVVDFFGLLYGINAQLITLDSQVMAGYFPEGVSEEDFPPPIEGQSYQVVDHFGAQQGHFIAWYIPMTVKPDLHPMITWIIDRTTEFDQIESSFISDRNSLVVRQLIIGGAALLLAFLVIIFIFRYLAKRYIIGPIAAISTTAQGIMNGTFTGEVVVDSRSDYAALQSATSDMIERRRAEAELLKTRDYLENLLVTFNTISDIFYVFDTEGKMLRWNRALIDVTGYTEEEVAGMRFVDFFADPDRARVENAIARAAEGANLLLEVPLTTRGGRKAAYELAAASLRDADNNPVGICGIGRDVTDRNDLQDKLLRAERLGVLGEMAGSMGHEMRNPLNVIKTSAFYLRSKLTGAEPKLLEHLDRVERGVERADNIITDLLSYSRIAAAMPKQVDILKLIEDALGEMNVPDGVEVAVKGPSDLPPGWVDPTQYGQLLHNLLLNSFQAMPEGGKLEIELSVADGYMQTVVRDTGTGISAEDLPKVFEPLFSTKAVGTGFGLAVCRRIVEDHKGTIGIESEGGKGTTVTVRLPLAETS